MTEPTSSAAEPQVTNGTTPPEQPQTELIFGKYKSLEEANEGYWNMVNYAADAMRKLNEYEHSDHRRDPIASRDERRASALAKIEELGVPRDLFTEAVKEITGPEFQNAFAPIVGAMRAREATVAKYPEFATEEAEVLRFVNKTPEVAERYANWINKGDPEGAYEYALLKYKAAKPAATNAQSAPARAGASLPGTASQAVRQVPTVDSGDVLERALQYKNQFGDDRPFAEEYLKGVIKHPGIPGE